MHLSQDGRYLVQTGQLNSGRAGIGFYDLQTGTWLQVHQAQPNELVYLGDRYSSDSANQIAIGLADTTSALPTWRVIVFDMTTGNAIESLRSDGAEIASFVGGEFLATTATKPHVLLLVNDGGAYHVQIRFDATVPGVDPFGAVAWYPRGAPGVFQELISSPYTASDIDLLPSRDAVYAYNEPAYPAGPPIGVAPYVIDSNAIGTLRPTGPTDISPTPQIFFADGVSTLYSPQWAEDGQVVLLRLSDGINEHVHWVRMGTALLQTMGQPAAQILGVPGGFVYNTGDGIYFMDTNAMTATGPVFADPMLSGSAAFVWATAYGNPPIALDMPLAPSGGAVVTPAPASGQPDLFVSEFSLIPATPVQGQPVEVRVGVYNQGDTAATGTFGIAWYPGENYPSPGCTWSLDGLVAHGGRILTCTYGGYPSPYGSINTRVMVDTANAIVESNKANNSYLQPISVSGSAPPVVNQPDLYVSEFSLTPATPVQGQPVEVRVGVYNQGDAAVSGTFGIAWYPGENYASPGCTWSIDGMAAHGGRILTCTYAGYPSPYGAINTKVMVDTGNAIAESNKANNSYLQPISVSGSAPPPTAPPMDTLAPLATAVPLATLVPFVTIAPVFTPIVIAQPDLYVSEFALNPATPVQGQPVQVRVGVYNQGNAAVSGSFGVAWYPGENYPSPGCTWTIDGMAAHGGRILTCTYAGYPSPYGSINTKVAVDMGSAVAESNESNNIFLQNIRVTSP